MNKKLIGSSFFLLILGFALVANTSAQTETVTLGVSSGDSFKYDLTFMWNSTLAGEFPPLYLLEENQTDYFQIGVQIASGTIVALQTSWRFRNGTENNSTALVDVSGVNENLTGYYVYAANLKAGDLLFPSSTLPWVINETTFRTYPGSNFRETNHIAVNRTDVLDKVYSYVSLYFDKQTGMLVESYFTDVFTAAPNQTFTVHFTLKESNAWVIPEFPSILVFPLFIAGTTAAVLILKKKRVVA